MLVAPDAPPNRGWNGWAERVATTVGVVRIRRLTRDDPINAVLSLPNTLIFAFQHISNNNDTIIKRSTACPLASFTP
ncbi:hypothetical protein AMS68_001636 [Peltaster fructicola]|uniref:Uncharacterized protein n=1 Tax=Peltaster fructicola TaxID=286661 RepID=A0A6H0XNB6_9PEZI|nr:hypothetical protein AMS68_001636 [Peltaster fructicola]